MNANRDNATNQKCLISCQDEIISDQLQCMLHEINKSIVKPAHPCS